MKIEMNRDDVERLLDLQVRAGRLTPEMKEEKLREYDMMVQQRGGGPGGANYQQGGANYQPENDRYPRIKPHPEGYLNGPEMIAFLVLAIVIIIAAKMNCGWLMELTMGIMFSYVSVRILTKDIKAGKGASYIPVIAGICGVGMLALGIFTLFGTEEMKVAFDSYSDIFLCSTMLIVGAGMIIGNIISRCSAKKKYTYAVQAKCIQLLSPRDGHNVPRRLSPVYEFYYNGKTHRVMNSSFSNRGNPRAGEVREIFINPENLDGYYDPKRSNAISIGIALIGCFFIVMTVLVMYLLQRG